MALLLRVEREENRVKGGGGDGGGMCAVHHVFVV